MSLVLRRIADLDPWITHGDKEDISSELADPPLWAIREFIPSAADQGSLSVFEVDEASTPKVAAAFGIHNGDLDKKKIAFISVSSSTLAANGFELKISKGNLHHKEADEFHRDLCGLTLDRLRALTILFLAGELHFFEGKEVGKTVRAEARSGNYDFEPIAKVGPNGMGAKNVLKFVAEQVVEVRGSLSA